MIELESVGPKTEFEIIADKQKRTREIIQRADMARSIPRCEACDWKTGVNCRQPLVSNFSVDVRGSEMWQEVSCKRAREAEDLCGPNAHLFAPMARYKIRAAERQRAVKAAKQIAVVASIGALVVGLVGVVIWMVGLKVFLAGVVLIAAVALFG